MLNYCIMDCYVDEPACFGVPPFISPYPRYLFGALIDAGVNESRIEYITIDALRESDYRLGTAYELVLLIGGAAVPGRYLGSAIGTMAEIKRIIGRNHEQRFAVGGLISRILPGAPNAVLVHNDIEKYAHQFVRSAPLDGRRSVEEIARWAVSGAAVVRLHPRFPDVICEVETYRGCPRESHCSFCVEGLFGPVIYREIRDIIAEIDALIDNGVSRFRLGRQADILEYQSDCTVFRKGFPKPAVTPIRELLAELRERKNRGLVRILNIDNANPGTIANFPEEASRILEELVSTITPGDTIALGVESFDDTVVRLNNLKATAAEAETAIEIINQIGGIRVDSVPCLLPGVNLIHGLAGETISTFATNYRRLSEIMDRGLLLKRINIRRLLPFPGTPLYGRRLRASKAIENRFAYYREKIRTEIEHTMLQRIYPIGMIVRENQILEIRAGYSYGKQIASYSITSKFPLPLQERQFYDAVVIGHRERSIITLPYPIDINSLPRNAVVRIPGIGKKRAVDIIMKRPFTDIAEARDLLAGVNRDIVNKMTAQ
ncbi:MAG: hypothetical protein A2176_05680 [Spirochaetes bacterium RBG_13_51_14]|nr:MAG: hypothetical protein A2176_05680 [Spirochaetes bacterium RBG_13_51_14]